MTEQTLCDVPSCDRPSDGWIVCKHCGETLRDVLRELAEWLLDDLDLVISRAVRYSSGGPKAKSAETPVLHNAKASDVRDGLVNEVVMTARMIAEDNDLELPEGGGREAAIWLHGEVSRIRLHEAGGAMAGDLVDRHEVAQRLVDRPPLKWYAGICSWPLGEGVECDRDLYASVQSGVLTCTKCGNTHDIENRRAIMLKKAEGVLVTATEAAHAIAAWGEHGSDNERLVRRIGAWKDRGRIEVKGHAYVSGKERPRYRLGDVLDLLAEAQRRAETKAN